MEPQTGTPLKPGVGQIEFKDVHFSYVPRPRGVGGLSLTINAGQVVGLVGPSGAGKTTTADLLLRLYDPESGEIFIDGQKLSQMRAATIRRDIGVVAADGACSAAR